MKEPRWNVNPSKLRAKIRTVILDLKEQEAYQATAPATVRAPRTDLDAVTTSFGALESILTDEAPDEALPAHRFTHLLAQISRELQAQEEPGFSRDISSLTD